jgi:multidrug resistance efflux pump
MEITQDPKTFEARLAQFGARIDDLLDTAEQAEFVSGLRKELGVWHEWIDEARLQAALGAMEGRDRVAEALKTLERLYSRMVKRVEELEQATEPLPGTSEAVKRELETAKVELSSPEAFAS